MFKTKERNTITSEHNMINTNHYNEFANDTLGNSELTVNNTSSNFENKLNTEFSNDLTESNLNKKRNNKVNGGLQGNNTNNEVKTNK